MNRSCVFDASSYDIQLVVVHAQDGPTPTLEPVTHHPNTGGEEKEGHHHHLLTNVSYITHPHSLTEIPHLAMVIDATWEEDLPAPQSKDVA
jgi:hypothetical protein